MNVFRPRRFLGKSEWCLPGLQPRKSNLAYRIAGGNTLMAHTEFVQGRFPISKVIESAMMVLLCSMEDRQGMSAFDFDFFGVAYYLQ